MSKLSTPKPIFFQKGPKLFSVDFALFSAFRVILFYQTFSFVSFRISTPNTPKTQSGNKPSQREAMISNILAMLENIEKLDTKIDKAKSYSIPTMSTKKELSNPSVTITNGK